MCGLTGIYSSPTGAIADLESVAVRMALEIQHRGPDDSGSWIDPNVGLAIAHRRLSVIDLSPAGHQPMISVCGKYVIAFNGEIYNHQALRSILESEGHSQFCRATWRGHSDTETLLACISAWGVDKTLLNCVGMFAIALWDRETGTLSLIRDRMGEKPLYYGWIQQNGNPNRKSVFAFASELKALRACPGFSNPVSPDALAEYMRFCYVPAPSSIYEDIFKLEPGCVFSIQFLPGKDGQRSGLAGNGTVRRWWSLSRTINSSLNSQSQAPPETVERLESLLSNAVKLQSLADVPLGAFLSGGIDSSTVVALMQQQSTRPIKTFTIGFEETDFDESPYARAVASHLGTEHQEMYLSAVEAQSVIADLPEIYDEPFADASQIPTYLVCQAARSEVTVALSGDGGDELFGGYNRYFWGPRIWSKVAWMPFPLRQILGNAILSIPVPGWESLNRPLNALLPERKGIVQLGDKAHKLASRLATVQSVEALYLSLITEWRDPASVVLGTSSHPPAGPTDSTPDDLSSVEWMMYRDSVGYLPDDILCKVDRAAMAVSLETRAPFLDHRVVELAWKLPMEFKIRNNQGKLALRQILQKYVPQRLFDRPKAGFGIPIGQWLRGPLRPWAEELLDESRLMLEGHFNPAPIRQKWEEHLLGLRDHTAGLWSVLMFQAWLAHTQKR